MLQLNETTKKSKKLCLGKIWYLALSIRCEQFNEKHLIKEYHIFLHNEELSVIICINIQEWMKNTYYKIEKFIGKVAQNGNQHTPRNII